MAKVDKVKHRDMLTLSLHEYLILMHVTLVCISTQGLALLVLISILGSLCASITDNYWGKWTKTCGHFSVFVHEVNLPLL